MKKNLAVLTPIVRWFLFAMILANIGAGMYGMLLPIYIRELGASVGQVGLVFTLVSVVMFFLQIVGGWVSDTIGRLRAIAIGSIGGIIGMVAMLLAPTWEWMIVALAINQIPHALVGPSFGAFLAENSTPENRGKIYGMTDMIYQVTGILGPPLGGWLAGQYGFKTMLLWSGVFYAIAAVLRIWMARTMHTPQDKSGRTLSFASFKNSIATMWAFIIGGGIITWIFITDGFRDIAFRMSGELQPLYLEQVGGIPLAQIGLLGSIFSLAMMSTPLLSGKLVDRYGERVPMVIGFGMISGAFAIFMSATNFWGFALAWVVIGAGVGLLSPAYQSLISKVVPQDKLGVFNGLFYSSMGLISLPAPWLGAQLWERFSPRLPFIITGFSALVSILPIWLKFKLPKSTPVTGAPDPDSSPSPDSTSPQDDQ